VLREVIWHKLASLVKEKKVTVLLTTHYLAEADERAHKVAFMREGRVLAESSPLGLKKAFCVESLDAVFVRVCQAETHQQPLISRQQDERITTQLENKLELLPWRPSCKALAYKDLLNAKRHVAFLAFQMLLPVLVLGLFSMSVGRDLDAVPLSLVNLDQPDCGANFTFQNCPDFDFAR
jgi:ABC-type glutathione transport system ATPase component